MKNNKQYNREIKRYTEKDKICPHCGGEISGNCCGERVIYWCEVCGSNNPKTPPNINLEVE